MDDVATPYEMLRKICLDPPSKKEKEKENRIVGSFFLSRGMLSDGRKKW